ncbi:LysR family transcriptional regulator [Geothrix sp. PMB-07]|uniref:LysR family transcriptional regulator n=1 Tax=Geothrix sp. PMB-07 TaxID=3068640 RepID=UPI002742186E|nr:LysR family transcriptional regulator [Geothrix sp. PMB-07]WLT32165.1 LysR family transcriptional regulator [Geothrix sp. PMB-07]
MDALLDLPQLRTFYTLAQSGSFTDCARKLNRTQSAVSHAMAKLEELAGVPLLSRKGRELGLTEEGRRLYAACEQAFATLDAAAEDLRRHQSLGRGRLRVGTTVEFGTSILMKHMQPFLTEHPGLEVDFTLSHDLLAPLLRDDLDLVIDCQEHPLPALKKVPLFRETYVVACSRAFKRAHRLKVPADLSGCPVLSLDKAGAWWNRFLMAVPDREQPQLDRVIAVNHIRAMIHAAAVGMGAALVPRYSVLEELERGDLVALFPDIRPTEDRFSIYQKKVKATHEKQRLLTQYLQSLSPAEFGS